MLNQKMMGLAALCVLLAACDMPNTTMENGAVTLKNSMVTLHVDGAPDAVINAQGQLQIGDKAITTTPAEQGLLVLYYEGIADVHDTGLNMGKLGAHMGKTALQDKLSGKSKDDTDKDAENGGNQMKALAHKICQDRVNMKATQNQLAAQLPDFKPYSRIFNDDNTKCDEDDDNF